MAGTMSALLYPTTLTSLSNGESMVKWENVEVRIWEINSGKRKIAPEIYFRRLSGRALSRRRRQMRST